MKSENNDANKISDITNATVIKSNETKCDDIGKRNVKMKEVIRCRKCWFSFRYGGNKIQANCPSCQNKIDARDRSEYSKHRKEHFISLTKNRKPKNRDSSKNLHNSAMFVISGNTNVKCNYCGCNDIRLLEINHKNGGGGKEMKGRSSTFYGDIIKYRRDVSDLEIACRVCNALHYLELKFGKLPYKIDYDK